ncbi:glycosyltransferase family 1 protein [Paenibacillus psychroresistens]|uniref:Glycosyltransferase family 1 protein n=1 Tax=Paenibacillus psychroresistens TaxID=1778678 RepID=A0A6B8RFL0_9BACL|nr:glycosyltransferase family 4 protein [Paenibacillus psychroresistens]QGQ94365.1 glycosyltransferase family 1 protein [Paenibacillus psychroresistens]
MKNILFIQPYASQIGGVDTVLLQLIQGLDVGQYKSYVLLSAPSPYVEKYKALGAEIIYGPIAVFGKPTSVGYYLHNFVKLFRSIPFLLRVVKEFQIDLIHSHKMEVMGANFVGKWVGIPTVQTIHELPRRPLFAYKIIAWMNHLMNDRVIVLCERSKIMFRWFNQESSKLIKIYNGIAVKASTSPSHSMALKQQLNLEPSSKLLITIARLSPMKGLEYLFEAAALIRTIHPDIKFVIVGDVAFAHEKVYKDQLHARIESLGLQNTVFMLGLRRDVTELIEQSDILVLPSVYDIFPTVILEAMSGGLPIIATDVGGIPEMVRPEIGIIVPPQNTEALKNAILTMCELDYKLMGQQAKKLFYEEFTQEQYVNQTIAVYESLFATQKLVLVEYE